MLFDVYLLEEMKEVWNDNRTIWEDGLDEDNFEFVKVVKKLVSNHHNLE